MNFKTTLALIALAAAAMDASAGTLSATPTFFNGFVPNASSSQSYNYVSSDLDFTVAVPGASVTTVTWDWNTVDGGGNLDLSSASLKVYSSSNVLLATYAVSDAAANDATGTTDSFNLASGNYYFVVSGTVPASDFASWSVSATASKLTGPVINAPEPATTALLLAGVGVMAFMGRRRVQK